MVSELRNYVPTVYPGKPVSDEMAVQTVVSAGWPLEALRIWAEETVMLTPHLISIRLEWRNN